MIHKKNKYRKYLYNFLINKNILNKKAFNIIIKKMNLFSHNRNQKINFIINFIIIFHSLSIKYQNVLIHSSNITIKIRSSGEQRIFDDTSCYHLISFSHPDEVYINNEKQQEVKPIYNLTSENNEVKLIWNNSINNCNCLFRSCNNITEIDFSEFDFSNGLYADGLFQNLDKITSINLYDYGIIKLYDVGSMFGCCKSLNFLNLSQFDISQVTDMGFMFNECESLKSLDLSSFVTSNISKLEGTFKDCKNLKYINLKRSFLTQEVNLIITDKIFLGTNNVTIYTNDEKLKSIISGFTGINIIGCSENFRLNNGATASDINKNNYIYEYQSECYEICPNGTYNNNYICENCHPDCKTCESPPTIDNTNCKSCYSNKYLQFGNCIDNCSIGYYIDINDPLNKICECNLEKCSTCSRESLKFNLCLECNEGYYQIYNDSRNNNSFINCYQTPDGYYLDINEKLYKECYKSCKICNISGNEEYHNCIQCNNDYNNEFKFNNFKNCYKNCSNYYYFDNNKYYCTENLECPQNFNKLIENKKECVNKCDDDEIYKYEFRNKCYQDCPEGSIKPENNSAKNIYYCEANCSLNEPFEIVSTQECVSICTIEDIYQNLCILNYNITSKVYSEDMILKSIELIFTSEGYNTSKLECGEDDILSNEKMIVTLTTTQNQKNNINNNNMTTVILGKCEDLLRKYYNISDNETLFMKKIDVIQQGMKITKVEYDIYSKLNRTKLEKLNLSICGDNEIYISVPIEISSENIDKLNSSSDYYKDICQTATSDSGTDMLLSDRKNEFIDGNKTVCQEECDFSDYIDSIQRANCSCKIKESSSSFNDMNINITKILEKFPNLDNETDISNLGIISCNVLASKENIESNTGFYLLLFILVIFIIIFIIFCSKGYSLLENKFDEVIYKRFKNEKKNKKNNIIKLQRKNKTNKINKRKNKKYISQNINNSHKYFLNTEDIQPKKDAKYKKIEYPSKENNNNVKFPKTRNFKPDIDYEFNWLSYKEALTYDKRTNCEYYCSLISSKQLFIFTFCSFNDYNSGVIKKFIFFLSFALHYTVNALFFNDSNMHQIYEDKGKFNFEYQSLYILYSAIISTVVLRLMLQILILTDKDIIEIKNQNDKKSAINMKKKKLKCIKIKFAIFFILNFIILLLFWYYLTCFNAVYKNTQLYLIENTFISFGFSLFYPFIINIIPIMLRYCSLHSSKKDKQYFYKLSQIMQVI